MRLNLREVLLNPYAGKPWGTPNCHKGYLNGVIIIRRSYYLESIFGSLIFVNPTWKRPKQAPITVLGNPMIRGGWVAMQLLWFGGVPDGCSVVQTMSACAWHWCPVPAPDRGMEPLRGKGADLPTKRRELGVTGYVAAKGLAHVTYVACLIFIALTVA